MAPRQPDSGWSSVIRVLFVVAALIVGPILIAFLILQA
jgi:hypothetical protein